MLCFGAAFATAAREMSRQEAAQSGASLFMLCFLVASCACLYLGSAYLLNRTWVRVDEKNVLVHTGPIPWSRSVLLPREQIVQVYGVCRQNRSSYGPRQKYELWLRLSDEAPRKILADVLTRERALFVKRELERALVLAETSQQFEQAD